VTLSGRSILLTGASGGIGRATAEILAREGANLTLVGRRPEPLESLRSRLEFRGGGAITVAADIRRPADATRAVNEAVKRFGRLDVLVNNAGIGYLASLPEADDSIVADLLETNVLGAFRMTRAAYAALGSSPGAIIVNVASFAGKVGVPYYSFYNASKFALVGMTEAWRRELGPKGIRVALVLPAAVETEFLAGLDRTRALGLGPAGTVLTAEEVARAIVGAIRSPRPETYVPRRNRWIGLLNVFTPRLADWIVNRLFRYPGRGA
jgi:short-subunit dehydrogenase